MKKINLQIAIISIISLLASTFAPIAYAVESTEAKNANVETAIGTEENTQETNSTDFVCTCGEPVVIVNGETKGKGESNIRLEFSSQNMPKIEIMKIKDGNITALGTLFDVIYNGSIVGNPTEIINNAEGNITLQVVYKNHNNAVAKTIYVVKKEYNSVQYDITTKEDLEAGISFKNNTLTIEKGKSSNEFVYENGEINVFDDVTVTVANENIAKAVKQGYGIKINALEIGQTSVTFEGESVKNGKATIQINVVENLYQYDKEQDSSKPQEGTSQGSTTKPSGSNQGTTNRPSRPSSSTQENTNKPQDTNQEENNNDKDENNKDENNNDENKEDEENKDENNDKEDEDNDIIPDDYDYVKYEERENIYSDYTKLNEELIQKADTLEITVEGNHVVKAEVFKALKKYPNKKLLINSSASGVGRITWEFDSNTITNTNIDFNPSAQFSTEKLNSIKNEDTNEGIYMDLAHNGELPGKASVSLWLGDELANKYIDQINEPIYLYYYNPSTNNYEYVGDAQMTDYGTIRFGLEHCSIYLFSSSKLEGKTTRPLDEEPKTGVKNYICLAGVIAIISLAGIMKLRK